MAVPRTSALALIVGILVAFHAQIAAAAPARIVSLSPSVTETLFALGAGAEVVGVSDYSGYPPAALKLPHVGSYLSPAIEMIAALEPTLIIGAGLSANSRQIEALAAMGYPTLMTDDNSLAGIYNSIQRIGDVIGRAGAARALRMRIKNHIAAIRARLGNAPPRTVLMVVGHQPMIAVGPGTFLNQLISMAGGINIAGKIDQSWPRLSIEYIIAMKPDVILDGQMGGDAPVASGFWSRYPTIPAVREHRIYGYPQDPTLHPGPRIWRSLEILATRIHPEAFNTPLHPPTQESALK
ncbi:MAG: ABC transporter substrate-binding protein [Candidatus Binataceae bacterium]